MPETTSASEAVEKSARRLVEYNAEGEPNLEMAYLFPDPTEIRLVELDATALPSDIDEVVAFHFPADPVARVEFKFAIAVIRPEEFRKLKLPAGWGTWDSATLLWSRH